jgi:hypothetical protein
MCDAFTNPSDGGTNAYHIAQHVRRIGTPSGLLGQLGTSRRGRGDQFELLCTWFLENDPVYANQTDEPTEEERWVQGPHQLKIQCSRQHREIVRFFLGVTMTHRR